MVHANSDLGTKGKDSINQKGSEKVEKFRREIERFCEMKKKSKKEEHRKRIRRDNDVQLEGVHRRISDTTNRHRLPGCARSSDA